MRTLDESRTFKIEPKPGDKIKVYSGSKNKKCQYSIAIRVLNRREREIVLLEKVNVEFELNEIDYCIDANKVNWTATSTTSRKNKNKTK